MSRGAYCLPLVVSMLVSPLLSDKFGIIVAPLNWSRIVPLTTQFVAMLGPLHMMQQLLAYLP